MNNEWYTPAKYIEAAREVMQGIDLDPASCELANQVVKATRYYTKEDNGLMQDWTCSSMWLNPPFGRVHPELKGSTKSYQVNFMHRLLEKYRSHEVGQAIALVFGTSCCMPWFQIYLQFPICLVSSRIDFDKPDGSKDHFGYGNIFVYLGPHESRFIENFSRFGRIVRAIDTPKPKPIPLTLF